MISPLPFLPRLTPRFVAVLTISVLLHAAALMLVHPRTAAYIPFRPLQVSLAPMAAETGDLGAAAGISELPARPAAPAAAAADAPLPESANTGTASVPGPDLRFIPDEYYTSREVDIRAEPLNEVLLVYPQLAYQYRTRGVVFLRILINQRGAIDDVSVVDSQPRGVFEEAALSATRQLKFSPAIRSGRPVKSQKTIEVTFDPHDNAHLP